MYWKEPNSINNRRRYQHGQYPGAIFWFVAVEFALMEMIQKSVSSYSISSNNKRIIRLIWHRKGDLRLYDNELYQLFDLTKDQQKPSKFLRKSQQSKSSDLSSIQTPISVLNTNIDNQLKIVSLYVINPDDYTPRLVTGSKASKKYIKNKSLKQQGVDDVDSSNLLWTVNEGPYASVALIDALNDLRSNLRKLGGELLVRQRNPLVEVPNIISNLIGHILDVDNKDKINQMDESNITQQCTIQVVWNEVPGSYEQKQRSKMKQILQNQFQTISSSKSRTSVRIQILTTAIYTLYHPNDLPTSSESWSQLSRPKQQQKKGRNKKSIKSKDDDSTSLQPETNVNQADCSKHDGSVYLVSWEIFDVLLVLIPKFDNVIQNHVLRPLCLSL
jgi:hypothetical protein